MNGLSYQKPVLVHYRTPPPLMDCMMEHMGVAHTEAVYVDGGLAWLGACTKCIFCHHIGECRTWLEGTATQTSPVDFCPNAEFFQSCAERSHS